MRSILKWIVASASALTPRLLIALGISVVAHLLLLSPIFLGAGDAGFSQTSHRRDFQHRVLATLAPPSPSPALEAEQASQADKPDIVPAENPAGAGRAVGEATQSFYTIEQLSRRPLPLGDDPLVGLEPGPLMDSGRIVFKLWINEYGRVVDVETEKSELPKEFLLAAEAMFRQARFSPALRSGIPVGAVIRVEVSYSDLRKSS